MFAITLLMAGGIPARAAELDERRTEPAGPKVAAELIAPTTSIRTGEPFKVGLHQRIIPNWHTYWKNPGDSGEPTRLTWTLPPGFSASPIAWPIPDAIPVGHLTNFGYSSEVLLPVTITPPATYDGTSVTLEAKAEWLACDKICVPEDKIVRLTLPINSGASTPAPSASADLFAATARAQPVAMDWPARVSRTSEGLRLDIQAPDLDRARISGVRFFPNAWGYVEHAAPQRLSWNERGPSLSLTAGELASAGMKSLDGVLVLTEQLSGGESVRNGVVLQATTRMTGAVAGSGTSAQAADTPSGLWQAVLFAILGGLILNLMPCVLPILSIKVMSLAGERDGGRRDQVSGAMAFLAGVLTSFAVLAAVLAILRGTGEALGWGFQFQSPGFVLAMAALFLAMGLSMSGVFDVGSNIVGAGQGLASRSGPAGSFFVGVLATIAATPCTAPFMGVAMGFALTRPAIEMMAVFLALGFGFALPLVALSISDGARRLLPRPGPWMETLKQALAFPLYATVAWLVWVLSLQTGSDGVLAAAVVLVTVAFAAWIFGRPTPAFPWRASSAAIACAAALAISMPLLRAAPASSPETRVARPSPDAAEPFTAARVAELRSAGRPVFVNLTAAWCISCKVNEQIALATDGVRRAIAEHNIAYLKGDWTSRDARITAVLQAYGRAGVPLYLLYPADPTAEAIVLPQLLTEAIVVRHFASLSGASASPKP